MGGKAVRRLKPGQRVLISADVRNIGGMTAVVLRPRRRIEDWLELLYVPPQRREGELPLRWAAYWTVAREKLERLGET
jgi:hypothetical protein